MCPLHVIISDHPTLCHPERSTPIRVILSEKTSLCGCFRVELSKICNELLIFESQSARIAL